MSVDLVERMKAWRGYRDLKMLLKCIANTKLTLPMSPGDVGRSAGQ